MTIKMVQCTTRGTPIGDFSLLMPITGDLDIVGHFLRSGVNSMLTLTKSDGQVVEYTLVDAVFCPLCDLAQTDDHDLCQACETPLEDQP